MKSLVSVHGELVEPWLTNIQSTDFKELLLPFDRLRANGLKIRVSLVRFRVRAPYSTRPCSNAGPFCYARLVEIWQVPVGLELQT